MKAVQSIIGVAGLCLALAAAPVHGQVCQTIFLPSAGIWQNGNNWTEDRPDADPANLKVGCIPVGKVCTVLQGGNHAAAKAIILEGKLVVEELRKLTLHEDSTITWDDVVGSENGHLILEEAATLEIAANLTITGDGGEIRQISVSPSDDSASITGFGALTIVGVGLPREESLTIRGKLGISLVLFNDAYVVADRKVLTLYNLAKKGGTNGHWVAEGGAKLVVNAPVLYNGVWQILQGGTSRIEINRPCQKLFGDVEIHTGTLSINADPPTGTIANFFTTGNLDLKSVNGSTGTILVAQPAVATFGN